MDKLVNFKKTLTELKKYLSLPICNDRDRAGIIQGFEFTFEQSWKSVQKVAAEQGVQVGSPKAAFSFAMQNKWIPTSEEPKWLALLKDRNLTSHTYHENLAHEVIERIQSQYVGMFEYLLAALEEQ